MRRLTVLMLTAEPHSGASASSWAAVVSGVSIRQAERTIRDALRRSISMGTPLPKKACVKTSLYFCPAKAVKTITSQIAGSTF